MIDPVSAYRALTSHDARFDDIFYVGVASTGIYCRPVCPVTAPRAEKCLFCPTAAAAEKNAFRPCLRIAPSWLQAMRRSFASQRVAACRVQPIDEGLGEQMDSLEQVAAEFHLSLLELRRIVKKALGVTPVEAAHGTHCSWMRSASRSKVLHGGCRFEPCTNYA